MRNMYESLLRIAGDIITLGGALLIILICIGVVIMLIIGIKFIKMINTVNTTVNNLAQVALVPLQIVNQFFNGSSTSKKRKSQRDNED
jgi:cell shape-determining protein MreC